MADVLIKEMGKLLKNPTPPLLARAGIGRVDHLFVTHWHPDHCAGLRVVETLS